MFRTHSATFVEKTASELYSHVDEDEAGHWDQSPSGQDKFSANGGTALLCQHVNEQQTSPLSLEIEEQGSWGVLPESAMDSPKLRPYTSSASFLTKDSFSSRRGSSPSKRAQCPRVATLSPAKCHVTYDFTPGPGYYSPYADNKGRKYGAGKGTVAWSVGKEGSARRTGRGTAIDKLAQHNAFQGVVPTNPNVQDITSDRPGTAQGVHIGYMSPGPVYNLPTEKVLTAVFSKSQRSQDLKKQHNSEVGSYTPSTVRTGAAVPFSNEKKANEAGFTFGKANRVQPKEYISRRHERILLSKESHGPAYYDTLRLALVYGTPPGKKKKHLQPRDGTLERPSTCPGMGTKGITLFDSVHKRGKEFPGPSDYAVKMDQVEAKGTEMSFGTSCQIESPYAGWNPSRSSHVMSRSSFTPQFISKMHALGLAGSFSPGPAMYSPGNPPTGSKKSQKVGTVFGTAHRFNPTYSGGLTDPISPTLTRRMESSVGVRDEDSKESMPMATTSWRGARVGAQELGRRSMSYRSNVSNTSSNKIKREVKKSSSNPSTLQSAEPTGSVSIEKGDGGGVL